MGQTDRRSPVLAPEELYLYESTVDRPDRTVPVCTYASLINLCGSLHSIVKYGQMDRHPAAGAYAGSPREIQNTSTTGPKRCSSPPHNRAAAQLRSLRFRSKGGTIPRGRPHQEDAVRRHRRAWTPAPSPLPSPSPLRSPLPFQRNATLSGLNSRSGIFGWRRLHRVASRRFVEISRHGLDVVRLPELVDLSQLGGSGREPSGEPLLRKSNQVR
jgi:hypothetical protein